jgi:hypothetical protein
LSHAETKSTLNSWNACYYSLQDFLVSCLLPENVEIKYAKLYFVLVLNVAEGVWEQGVEESI